MLTFLYAQDLDARPLLRDSMFRDRAAQFQGRLGWPVSVDADGREQDQYDVLNPLYVIWERPDGRHGGSARFLPTTGRTMVNEHFSHLADGVEFRSPFIWECTRFCLAPGADARVAPALMLGGAELMRAFSLTHLVGVFDSFMTRVYGRIGAIPEVLGSKDGIAVGLWHEDPAMRESLLARSGLTNGLVESCFERDFGGGAELGLAA
jgi:N-acyl-L-homoserine lactone synthetase